MVKLPRIRMPSLRRAKLPLPSSVRGRIITGFGSLVVILIVVVAASAWLARQHQSTLAETEQRTATASLFEEARLSGEPLIPLLQSYLTTGDESMASYLRTQSFDVIASLGEVRTQMEAQGRDADIARLDELITETIPLLSEAMIEVITLRRSGDVEGATAALDKASLQTDYLRGEFEDLGRQELEAAADLQSQAERTSDLVLWLLVVSGIIGAALALAVSAFIARSILRPLSSLESAALAVAGGDLEARASATGPRELSHLGQTLNGMLATVQQRTDDLRSANEELRERNRQLLEARSQAATDALTGLGNHRTFHLVVKECIRKAQATGSRVGLVMLDIDGFKEINDSLGHLVGDEVLRQVARALIEAVGQDKAYRYGGDEFVVLLPETGVQEAVERAEELRRAVATRTDGNGNQITVSLGVASFPDTAESTEELVYRADAAMYWAKAAGKDRVAEWADLAGASASETKTERQRTEPPRVTTARGG